MIPALINLVFWLLIICILVALAFWVLTQIPGIPTPIVQIIRVALVVIVVLVIVLLLIQMVGGGGPNFPKLTLGPGMMPVVT